MGVEPIRAEFMMTTETTTAKVGEDLAVEYMDSVAWYPDNGERLLSEFYEWLLKEGIVLTREDHDEQMADTERAMTPPFVTWDSEGKAYSLMPVKETTLEVFYAVRTPSQDKESLHEQAKKAYKRLGKKYGSE